MLDGHSVKSIILKINLPNTKQISLIEQNPKLFPISQYNPKLRKAVLSKQTTIFYEVTGQIIYLVYIFNNKLEIEKIIGT